jgi:outer membrane protein
MFGIAALALALASPPAMAAALAEIYRLARENDAELAAAEAAARAGREAWSQARAAMLPTLTATASVSEVEREVTQTPFSDQSGGATGQPTPPFEDSFRSERFGVELRQPLFDWSIPAQLRQGRDRVTIAELDLKTAATQLRARVMQAYVGYLSTEAELEFAREERLAIASDLERTRGRFEVGEVSITALREAQAALDLAEARIIEAQADMDEAREELREITGRWFESLPGIDGEVPLEPPQPAGPDAWVDIAMHYNSVYLSAVLRERIAEEEITRRQSGLLPDLDLVAAYVDSDDTEFVFGSAANDSSIGLEASWRLFAGGRGRSEVREARALYDQSHAEIDVARRQVATATRNAYRRVISDAARVRALDRAVASARTALESVEAEFEVGERTQADVLDARRNLYAALTGRATARYGFLSGVIQLKLIAGTLSMEDVTRLDGRLAGSGEADTAIPVDRE